MSIAIRRLLICLYSTKGSNPSSVVIILSMCVSVFVCVFSSDLLLRSLSTRKVNPVVRGWSRWVSVGRLALRANSSLFFWVRGVRFVPSGNRSTCRKEFGAAVGVSHVTIKTIIVRYGFQLLEILAPSLSFGKKPYLHTGNIYRLTSVSNICFASLTNLIISCAT